MKKRCIAAALLLVFTLLLPACDKGEPPNVAAENLFRAIKREDNAVIGKYMGKDPNASSVNPEITEDALNIAKEGNAMILERLSFEINDFYEEKNKATVDVKITCLDMTEIFQAYLQQIVALSMENAQATEDKKLTDAQLQEKMAQVLLDLMKKEDAPMSTDVLVLEMKRSGKSWKVTNHQEVRDAITAGMDSLAKQMKDELSSAKPQT